METQWLIGLALTLLLPIALIIAGIWKSRRADEHDILQTGLAAEGTLLAIRAVSDGEGGKQWVVTVEFTPKGQSAPVRFDTTTFRTSTFGPPARIAALRVGQRVPIHYRAKWPSLAVVDSLVS